MPLAPTLTTTIAAAVAADSTTVHLASVSGLSNGDVLVVGREVMSIARVEPPSTVVAVRRGIDGSGMVAHRSGVGAYGGPTTEFGVDENGVYLRGYAGALGEHARMRPPLGSVYVNADDAHEYRLVRSTSAATVANDWVSITGGDAAQMPLEASIVPSHVGVCIETPVAQNDWMWVLVRGRYATAKAGTVAGQSVLGFGAVVGEVGVFGGVDLGVRCYRAGNQSSALGGVVGAIMDHPFVDGFITP